MIKKKLNILLLLSLVALFIGSFSTCYAFEPTINELKNFICNYAYAYNNNVDMDALKNKLDNSETNLNRWLDIINRYQGQYILSGANGRVMLWCYRNKSNATTQKPYYYSNQVLVNTSYINRWRNDFTITDFNFQSEGSYDTYIRDTRLGYYFYTDCNIYTNTSYNSILYNAGYMTPSNLFEGYYTDDYFTFLLNSSLPTMTINGDEVPYYNLQTNQAESFTLGQLGLAKNFDYAELDSWRYQNGDWKHIGYSTLYSIGTTTDNLISVTIYGNMVNSNTLYNLTMYSNNDDFPNYSQPFYITDRNTIITNGALNTNDTFSGDYYNNYNNDTNTDKVINNDNNLYDKMFKVSGDKIDEIFTNAMENIEIESGELAEFEIIKNYLQGEPRRFYYIVAVHIRQTLRYKDKQ